MRTVSRRHPPSRRVGPPAPVVAPAAEGATVPRVGSGEAPWLIHKPWGITRRWPVDKCGPPTTPSYDARRSQGPTRRSGKSSKNSVAHSRQRYALRIPVLSARTRPRARISALRHCGQTRSRVSLGGGELEFGMAHRHVVVSIGEELPQCLLHLVRRHRAHQLRVESRGSTPLLLLGLITSGHGDEPELFANHAAQDPGERPAVDDRHADQ